MKRHARDRRKADLHLHSTSSDGLWPPERVVEKAARCGVTILALTDHDTFAGLDAASRAATAAGVELVPGIEISVDHPGSGERHLLAYGMDTGDPGLNAALRENVEARIERVARMIAALKSAGVDLTEDDVFAQAGGNVGRPHVADALVKKGLVRNRQEAFDRWLGDGRIAHVVKRNLDASRAIAAVHAAGGVAVLAHPGRRWDPAMIEALVRAGLDGLETMHPSNSAWQAKSLTEMATRFGLLVTGGSDCHGDAEGEGNLRSQDVPLSAAEALLERVALRARSVGGRA